MDHVLGSHRDLRNPLLGVALAVGEPLVELPARHVLHHKVHLLQDDDQGSPLLPKTKLLLFREF